MFTGPLEDRVAIAELNGTYADGVVRFDADTWGSVWANDADWDLMGHKTKGKDAIVLPAEAANFSASSVAIAFERDSEPRGLEVTRRMDDMCNSSKDDWPLGAGLPCIYVRARINETVII